MTAYEVTVDIRGRYGTAVYDTSNMAHAAKLGVADCIDDEEPEAVHVTVRTLPTGVRWERDEDLG
ncbi:MAG: hypothetical protein U9R79_05910 [Armatimonadota bacterium]|nr:hypothetical protein [Armatimonadota bacterium]